MDREFAQTRSGRHKIIADIDLVQIDRKLALT